MINTLQVIRPGLMTTVQDVEGRTGLRKIGIPISGALDTHGAVLANWLVGNDRNDPLLEITLGNCEFEFTRDTVVGVTGGEAEVRIGERTVDPYRSLNVAKGERLKIGGVNKGVRVYLAVAGTMKLNRVYGSFSTYNVAGLGGLDGRKFKTGDKIDINVSEVIYRDRSVAKKLIPHYSQHQKIRVLAGPEWKMLSREQKKFMLKQRFKVSGKSDRMGLRLQSRQKLKLKDVEFSSSPVVPGIIQLPLGGEPIILMKDAQSVGGYPRILKVIEADLWRLGQLWQGNEISFTLIGRRDAIELFDYYETLRASYLK